MLVPLEALAHLRPGARFEERVRIFEACYREGRELPPIPVRVTLRGELVLSRDGNHRLEAARRAGVESVPVRVDARVADALEQRFFAAETP